MLAKSLDAADIGYQTPSSGGGALAPLTPQSLDGKIATATYGAEARTITISKLAKILARKFGVSYEKALVVAKSLKDTFGV